MRTPKNEDTKTIRAWVKKNIKKFVLYHSSNEVYYDMYLRGNILRTESAEMELYEAVLILIKLYG